ncbi:MAG: ribosome recycling factor [Candidatus Woykebacteria bacterium RIFCSPLOWO2_01_FULL_43_14]|uniref:Ribosome-recycling factor n=1 Tax=Candidatus Woykebacteria bacterium RIFCSPLOWO2_01_FULL_43_14 TaxID=1802605 RepID=A0A1G1WWA6_9BACT|nr:MAG: ribosome recycling factor [Candidatus Woykebacteria bacterium RIFCSPLOWO2_01_FULL_43_14]
MEQILIEAQTKITKTLEVFKTELSGVRTGRANTGLIEGVKVDAYGSTVNLRDLGSINAPDPKTLTVQPWDPSLLDTIAKAIGNAGLGFSATADSGVVRVSIPALTEERRREFLKLVNDRSENAKVSVRQIRREIIEALDRMEKSKDLSEDDNKRTQDRLQKVIDEANSQITTLADAKSKEIMTI